MQDRFALMLEMQRQLQLVMPPPNRVPADLRGEERATFVTWNMFAIEDELHEAIAEMGWKPWATSRHLDTRAMLKEMVDAWHFFMNVLLVIGGEAGWTIDELADEFTKRYIDKNAENIRRQQDGYDGVSSKCPSCKRELSETEPDHLQTCGGMMAEPVDPVTPEQAEANRLADFERAQARRDEMRRRAEERIQGQGVPKWEGPIEVMLPETPSYSIDKGHEILSHLIPGEPFFVFRAKDVLSSFALDEYAKLVEKFNSESPQVESLYEAIESFRTWQRENPGLVKLPD